jgi:hypothetical protein
MVSAKRQRKNEWLDEGIRHLGSLCKQAAEYADEGDIIPTKEEIDSATALMRELSHVHAPKIGVTVNGETVLAWESNNDCYKAYVGRDGVRKFYRNKSLVDQLAFARYLAAAPA